MFEGFLDLLREKPELLADEAASTDACRVYYRTLSRLGAFCRSYADRIVRVLDEVERALDAKQANETVKKVVWGSLRLGRGHFSSESVYDAAYFVKRRDPQAVRLSETSVDAS